MQRHPEGIASVAFLEFEAADLCITRMDQRWYAGRQLAVSAWDGITNFQIEETDLEREERLKKWENFISGEEATEASEDTGKDSIEEEESNEEEEVVAKELSTEEDSVVCGDEDGAISRASGDTGTSDK